MENNNTLIERNQAGGELDLNIKRGAVSLVLARLYFEFGTNSNAF